MQFEQDKEIERFSQIVVEESDTYSLFMNAVRSQITLDYYLPSTDIISSIFLDSSNKEIKIQN
jgi:hypothetical protein